MDSGILPGKTIPSTKDKASTPQKSIALVHPISKTMKLGTSWLNQGSNSAGSRGKIGAELTLFVRMEMR